MGYEVGRAVNGRWWRWLTCWFAEAVWIVIAYRVSRALYLLLGPGHAVLRLLLAPALFLLRPWFWGHAEIHHKADIGPGLKILHPSLGLVISAATVAGRHLTLTGGNCIGGRSALHQGQITLGDHVFLGVNAVVLGPVRIGNRVAIAAGAVVTRDADDDLTLVGVPARPKDAFTARAS